MEVREVAGACGTMMHVVPTVWRADAATVCILLENPRNERWILIALDVRDEPAGVPASRPEEAARW